MTPRKPQSAEKRGIAAMKALDEQARAIAQLFIDAGEDPITACVILRRAAMILDPAGVRHREGVNPASERDHAA